MDYYNQTLEDCLGQRYLKYTISILLAVPMIILLSLMLQEESQIKILTCSYDNVSNMYRKDRYYCFNATIIYENKFNSHLEYCSRWRVETSKFLDGIKKNHEGDCRCQYIDGMMKCFFLQTPCTIIGLCFIYL